MQLAAMLALQTWLLTFFGCGLPDKDVPVGQARFHSKKPLFLFRPLVRTGVSRVPGDLSAQTANPFPI